MKSLSIPPAKLLDVESLQLSLPFGSDNTSERLPDEEISSILEHKAYRALAASPKGYTNPYPYETLEYQNDTGDSIISRENILLHPVFEKLFEGRFIPDVSWVTSFHIFGYHIGYDDYFKCPVIIVRDETGKVVDLVKYRPVLPGKEMPKYLQQKASDKLKNRGEKFLYIFQPETQRLIAKEKYVLVGEGLKNGINALIRSVPFISIESASNVNNPKLIEYLNVYRRNGIEIYGAMDGDPAGKKAFEAIGTKLEKSITNLIDFKKNIDFTDYLREGDL